ncbi:carbohydrate kinase [Ascidiimonas aurantiaca]|uniref:carbohydrate kinase family protein n=1 Tax=Ascidiimonas aurantiaca TaxID=1685432 RepID=UPI0030EC9853
MKKVYCIGEILIDFVAEHQGKNLTEARQFVKKAGGAPANVAAAIAKLGGQSFFVGAAGNDPFGHFLKETLINHKVSIQFMQQYHTFTTLAFVSLSENGERDFVFNRGADADLTYDKNVSSQFYDHILHFGSATAFLEGSLKTTYRTYLDRAVAGNCLICFDPNYRSDLWKNNEEAFKDSCYTFLKKCHLAKLSLEEALLLSNTNMLETALKNLRAHSQAVLCITLGEKGTLVSTPEFTMTVPSILVKPVDTTGAGDAFIGCLLKELADISHPLAVLTNQDLLKNLVKRANAFGALTTTRLGAIEALPSKEMLDTINFQ